MLVWRLLLLIAVLAGGFGDCAAVEAIGPKTVCLRWTYFQLAAGELITETMRGFHNLGVAIRGLHGGYQVWENDILIPDVGELLLEQQGRRIHRSRKDPQTYVVVGKIDGFPEDRALLVLSGDALDGSSKDAEIYMRFQVGAPPAGCDLRVKGMFD
ncbi:MAG: hypothetical protein IT548_05075 [Alphaproteobacteria bacterium]|nr:hypothetical protein [Alphaproteobacteria bacterium]